LFSALFCATAFAQQQEEKAAPPSSANQEVDTEKYPNKSLVQASWEQYNAKNYDKAIIYAERCISLYDAKAKQMHASLSAPIPDNKINMFWMLNDVATAKFIKARCLWLKKDAPQAKQVLSDIIQNYKYAMAYDVRGWHWSVAAAAGDMLRAIGMGIDFGDSSSSFLTMKAWESYTKKDYQVALAYAEQCILMYKEAALWQQKSLRKYPNKEEIEKYWALNDVGTCCYLAGKSAVQLGGEENRKKAREYFSLVKTKLYYASCWDTRGWYWKVADALKRR